MHPASKEIVLKHLSPLSVDVARLSSVDAMLSSLMGNVGGGIPYHTIVALIVPIPAHPTSSSGYIRPVNPV